MLRTVWFYPKPFCVTINKQTVTQPKAKSVPKQYFFLAVILNLFIIATENAFSNH